MPAPSEDEARTGLPWESNGSAALADNGYTVLRNQHRTVEVAGAPLHVIGIDDPVTGRHDLAAAFAEVPAEGSRLVLCHCPEQIDDIAARGAHLVLSGHTHGGQINVRGITDRILTRRDDVGCGVRARIEHRPMLYVASEAGSHIAPCAFGIGAWIEDRPMLHLGADARSNIDETDRHVIATWLHGMPDASKPITIC